MKREVYAGKLEDVPTKIETIYGDLEEIKALFDKRAETGDRYFWPEEGSLVGIHARNDYHLAQADLDIIRIARIEAIKFLSFTDPSEAERVREINPDIFILVRLFSGELDSGEMQTPIDFVEARELEIKGWLAQGVRHFEVTNEPNLLCKKYGLFCSPEGFCIWFEQVLTLLREQFAQAKFGFPGLSPPLDDLGWLDGCSSAIGKADFLGFHAYWHTWDDFHYWSKRYELYHEKFPNKTIIVTEFSNPTLGPEGEAIEQYLSFYKMLRKTPYIKAAMSFIQSSPDPQWHKEAWRAEDGVFKPIVFALGARDF